MLVLAQRASPVFEPNAAYDPREAPTRLSKPPCDVTTLVMKLYVCWGTFPVPWPRTRASWRPHAHPCKRAHDALKEAGYSPEVVKSYGLAPLPDVTSGRREVKRLTGESFVPVLVTDDGEVVSQSGNIVRWAENHPPRAGQARP